MALGDVAGWTQGGGLPGPGATARMYRLAETDLTLVLLANTGGDVAETVADSLIVEVVRAALGTDAPNG